MGKGLEDIGESAFCYSDFTGELVIPKTVKIIRNGAFAGCEGFTGSLVIPGNVEYIGGSAFWYCSGFTGSLTLSEGIKEIRDTEIDVEEDEYEYYGCGGSPFEGCNFTGDLIIPKSMTSIRAEAFSNVTCFKRGRLVISNGVVNILDSAFEGCTGFTGNLTIPESVEKIGGSAFSGCTGFTGNLVIPDNVEKIGELAFSGCTGFMGKIVIGRNVKSIGTAAFQSLKGITEPLEIPAGITHLGDDGEAAFGDLPQVKKVINHSNISVDLSLLSTGKWFDAYSKIEISEIKNGIAIREDYGEGEDEEEIPTVEELTKIIYNMLNDNIGAEKIKVIGPTLEIADQEINVFEQEFKIDISSMFGNKLQIPFEYNANDQSLKITIGTTVAEGEKTIIPKRSKPDPSRSFAMCFQQMKSFYRTFKGKDAKMNDLYSKYAEFSSNLRKSKGSIGLDGDVKVFGYLNVKLAKEYTRLPNGEYGKAWVPSKLNEGGVMLSCEGSAVYTAHPFAPPLTIVFLQAELDGGVDGTMRFVQNGQSFVNMADSVMTADGKVALSGAVGAGAEAIDLYAKGGVKGTLNAKTDIMPKAKLNEITASIGAFIEWCVFNIPGLTGSLEGTGWEWELYPERKMTKNILAAAPSYRSPLKASSEQKIELLRSWVGTIDADDPIYRFSGVRITDLGDKKLLLTYLDDSVTGADGKVKLMYRYYDGNAWSDGKVVNSASFVDSDGMVSIVEGAPYIIYQGTESAINDGDNAETVIGKLALYAARFNGTSFDAAKKIGETGKIRYSYSVCKLDGEVKAVWAENANNNIEGDHGNTAIYKCSLEESAVPVIVNTITGSKGRAVINTDETGIKYAYYDGSSTVKVNGTDVDMSDYGKGVHVVTFDGDNTYLLSSGKLYEYDGGVKDVSVSCNSMYRVYGDYAYYTVQDGFRSELYRKKLNSDEPAVRLTDDGGFINNFDLIAGIDPGHDRIAYGFQPVDEEKSNPYGLCTLKFTDNPVRYSASINSIGYDMLDFAPGRSNKVYLTIENTGTEALNNVMLTVSAKGQEIYNDAVVDRIEVNEVKEFILDVDFPGDYDGSDVKFSLTADENLDKKAEGVFRFEFSLVDLDVTVSVSDNIIVREADTSPVNDVEVKLYDSFEDESRLIRTVKVDTIEAGKSYSEGITDEDWDKVTLDEASGFRDMIICVSTSEEEDNLGNNSVIVSLSEKENTDEKDDNNGDNQNSAVSENILSKTASKTFTAGSDTYTVSWNSFVRFDGRKHNGVGTDAGGNPAGAKESGSKTCDIKLAITKNGELVEPLKFKVKVKNNRNASVSIDGVTAIASNTKIPSFKIKFKGKEFKEANKAVKNFTFEFGIIPAELKQENVTFDKVKTEKDGKTEIKKLTFMPEAVEGRIAPKAIKLKYKKQESKTDYVTKNNPDDSVTVTGKNNYYGSVVYRK